MTKENDWKRFSIYERLTMWVFIINLIFIIINKEILKSKFPESIQGYLFFLSLGLYIGFLLCKNEYTRVLKKKNNKQE